VANKQWVGDSMAWSADPIVVGATGGSGTRVIARLLQRAGAFMGADVNQAGDSLPIALFLDIWVNVYTARSRLFLEEEARAVESAMIRSLHEAIGRHLATAPAGPWGWKAPNSIYVLPFLNDQFPQVRFVHLIRDGRDMAFSDNQRQLTIHGRSYLTRAEEELHGQRERSVALWALANLEAADYGERVLGERYLRIRFEDLCTEPVATVDRLLTFVGSNADADRLAHDEISPPASLGRWRDENARILRRIGRVACLQLALKRFGYLE
jgi:hypothetical protein